MAREKTDAETAAEKERAKRVKDGKLTRYGMEKTIQEGGAVIHGGINYSKVDDLPDEAELVRGDAEATEQALAALEADEMRLAARRSRLERTRETASATRPDDKAPANPTTAPAKK